MGRYTLSCPKGTFEFDTKEEFDKFHAEYETEKNNERQYAKVHPSEKKHYLFHGGCSDCVTPLEYGVGNCTGCRYFEFDFKKPDLGIRRL